MRDLLEQLTKPFGVSGCENNVTEVIRALMMPLADEVYTDVMGNLYAIRKGTGNGKKVMLAAHMDEIGFVVKHIDDKGFLRLAQVGYIQPHYALSQKIRFENGLIGVLHYEEKLDDFRQLKLPKMYADIGATTREDAMKVVGIGDRAKYESVLHDVGSLWSSGSMDDRCGCAVLVKVAQLLQGKNLDNDVIFAFTSQEEVGTRGATTAGFIHQPDVAIAVDVTTTGDTPECDLMEVSLGKGPTVKVMDRLHVCDRDVFRKLCDIAEKQNIPWQPEILEAGTNDARAIQLSGQGVAVGSVSIPCRYVHTPCEMIHPDDLRHAAELLCEAAIAW